MKYLISSCQVGINCKCNGSNTLHEHLRELLLSGEAIPFCPEMLGVLSAPGEPCERVGDKVRGKSGRDYTDRFADGARKTLAICQRLGISEAILQSRKKRKHPALHRNRHRGRGNPVRRRIRFLPHRVACLVQEA